MYLGGNTCSVGRGTNAIIGCGESPHLSRAEASSLLSSTRYMCGLGKPCAVISEIAIYTWLATLVERGLFFVRGSGGRGLRIAIQGPGIRNTLQSGEAPPAVGRHLRRQSCHAL